MWTVRTAQIDYTRILFVHCTSTFNTITIPAQLTPPAGGSHFLSDRKQHLRMGKHVPDSQAISAGSQSILRSPNAS
ncbi:hypothetical protein NQZ68_033681 [Dissostichus eleginoides]|nr:hypothetical protein NQZ68_033681 [Dissostichus eleginoides]